MYVYINPGLCNELSNVFKRGVGENISQEFVLKCYSYISIPPLIKHHQIQGISFKIKLYTLEKFIRPRGTRRVYQLFLNIFNEHVVQYIMWYIIFSVYIYFFFYEPKCILCYDHKVGSRYIEAHVKKRIISK